MVCKWETASETNNAYFDVERSQDGETFEKIGKVDGFGAGVSTINHEYKFIDDDVCNSIRYYRLKQTDIDGQFSYSETVAVNCADREGGVFIFPNPATSELNITFYEANKGDIGIEIIDILGKVISSEIYPTLKGYNKIATTVIDLPTGIYYIMLKSGKSNPSQEDRQIRFVKE